MERYGTHYCGSAPKYAADTNTNAYPDSARLLPQSIPFHSYFTRSGTIRERVYKISLAILEPRVGIETEFHSLGHEDLKFCSRFLIYRVLQPSSLCSYVQRCPPSYLWWYLLLATCLRNRQHCIGMRWMVGWNSSKVIKKGRLRIGLMFRNSMPGEYRRRHT
nr:hypothetical protein CFP56_11763 [Quercus suber]